MSSTTEVRHVIGREWVGSASEQTFETRDPHDGSLLAHVARGGAVEGAAAVTAAPTAFDDGPWPRTSTKERRRVLHAVTDALGAHHDELAMSETRDGGKAITQSRDAEIPRASLNLRFFADYAAVGPNEAYPDGDLFGVVSAISPWNAPLMPATWKMAPALAFGNTVVRAGTVWIHCFFERDLRLPVGGERASGVGPQGGRYSREFFAEPHAVTVRVRG